MRYTSPVADARRRSWLPFLALALVLAFPLAAWLLRGNIATAIVRSELEARGIGCDERFAIELSAFVDEARIRPTRCTLGEGLLEAVELAAETKVELEAFSPVAIRASSVTLVLRDRDVRGGSGWAAQLRRIDLEQRVAGLVKGLAEIGGMDLPFTEVARVDVRRGAEPLATIDGLILTPSTSTELEVRRIAFHPVGGAVRLILEEVRGRASTSAVELEGHATARAGIAILAISRAGAFVLEATNLDTDTPQLRLRAEL